MLKPASGVYQETNRYNAEIIAYYNSSNNLVHTGVVVSAMEGTENGVCGDSNLVMVESKWGGSIININFSNITIKGNSSSTTKVAIIGQMVDGYLKNIYLKNITAYGYQGVAALVGQVSGGTNTISHISLINDDTSSIFSTGKYMGGLVGNFQKDSSETFCTLLIDNCYVNGNVGGKNDTGGYAGGIVGRCKNDSTISKLIITKCVVYGMILTGKNYAGGIVGGCDYGFGYIELSYCVADVTLYYAGTVIDGNKNMSVKNGSPIFGRLTLGTGTNLFFGNYASFQDFNADVADGSDYSIRVFLQSFWTNAIKFDLQNDWLYDSASGRVSLRTK